MQHSGWPITDDNVARTRPSATGVNARQIDHILRQIPPDEGMAGIWTMGSGMTDSPVDWWPTEGGMIILMPPRCNQ